MIDGSDDKAGIGERLGRIVMADEGAAPAVRDNDERQLVAADRTILNTGHGYVAKVDLARRLGAGRPDRSLEGRTVSVRGHVDEAKTRGLCERRRETEDDRDEEFGSVHQRVSWLRASPTQWITEQKGSETS